MSANKHLRMMASLVFFFFLAFGLPVVHVAAAPVRIMPLGDSITSGIYTGGTLPSEGEKIGYRFDLWQMLQNDLYESDFVGSLRAGYDIDPSFDPDHEGHGGYRTGDILGNIDDFLAANPPDIILLHIGTNDLNGNLPAQEVVANVAAILDAVDAFDENAIVLLALIIDGVRVDQNEPNPRYENYNQQLRDMARARIAQGDRILLVDMFEGAGLIYATTENGGDMYDAIHPFAPGYAKMADQWYEALWEIRAPPEPPLITSDPVTRAVQGQPYMYAVAAEGTPAPIFDIIDGPPDMQVDAVSGVVSWMPPATGEYNVAIRAFNWAGEHIQEYVIVVSAEGQPPLITSDPVTQAVQGQEYLYTMVAEGAPAPTFELIDGPAGMQVDAVSGEVSWIPPAAGDFNVFLRAFNSSGEDIQEYVITVRAPQEEPLIISDPVTQAIQGQEYLYTMAAEGVPAPTFELIDGPPDMQVNATSGVVRWMPPAAGDFPVLLRAINSAGEDIQEYVITVRAPGEEPPPPPASDGGGGGGCFIGSLAPGRSG